jgi:hypothetical protein
MFRVFVGFTLAVLPPLLFVAYCRSLILQASQIGLGAAVLRAIATKSGSVSAKDFHRLQALVGLCPLGQKDGATLAAVSAYYFLLTGLYGISSAICEVVANWTERERQRCSYFVAVRLDQRIANTRKLWAEQMIHQEEQGKSPTSSSESQ